MSISDLFKHYSLPEDKYNSSTKEIPELTPRFRPQRVEKVDNFDFESEQGNTENTLNKKNNDSKLEINTFVNPTLPRRFPRQIGEELSFDVFDEEDSEDILEINTHLNPTMPRRFPKQIGEELDFDVFDEEDSEDIME